MEFRYPKCGANPKLQDKIAELEKENSKLKQYVNDAKRNHSYLVEEHARLEGKLREALSKYAQGGSFSDFLRAVKEEIL